MANDGLRGNDMESKYTGHNLGGASRQGLGAIPPFFIVALLCLMIIGGVARAQTCPTPPTGCTPENQETDCNDGQFCTVDLCIVSTPNFCFCSQRSCDDGLFCTVDSCNEATDTCDHAARDCPSETPFCNEATDACVECLQNADCTVSPRLTCLNGACVECTNHSFCQDGSYCNGLESCNFSTGLCEPGTPVSCTKTCFMGPTPGAECSTDANCGSGGQCLGFCSETSKGRCVQCTSDAGCSDGKFCNGAETCSNELCVVGTAPDCRRCVGGPSPGAACQFDAACGTGGTCTGATSFCDETFDRCQVCLTNAHCDDALFCTTDNCTQFGSLKICNNIPDPARFCDDGLFCNGAEECSPDNTTCVAGTPPVCQKTCFGGSNPGAACTGDSGCPKKCVGGSNHGNPCTVNTNCPNNGTCATAKCLGFCNEEPFRACVQCEFNSTCNDGFFCNGSETCSASGQCVAGSTANCTAQDNPPCGVGTCNESTDQCFTLATNNGVQCSDNNHCTASTKCSGGQCVNDPPAANDPYRCVRLEWRPSAPIVATIGSTVALSLYAVADGCNTTSSHCPAVQHPVSAIEALLSWVPSKLELVASSPSNPNPQEPCGQSNACFQCQTCTGGTNPGASCFQQCVGGSNHGQVCFNSNHCPGGACNSGPVCIGGTNNGNTCTSNGNCPGGGQCDNTVVCRGGLNPGSPCTSDAACTGGGTCAGKCLGGGTCAPPTVYNWASSFFPNDCPSSQMNGPCPSLGFPGNDGDAYYQSIQPLACSGAPARPACINPNGTEVARYKFKVLSGPLGSTTVSLLPCGTVPRRIQVQSTEIPPCCSGGVCSTCMPGQESSYSTDDVLKSLGPAATINVVACSADADCNDNDGCTLDSCLANACRNVPMSCQDPDPCTIDSCSNGVCRHDPVPCDEGEVCYQGTCFKACSSAEICDDGVDCTVDTCDLSPPPPIDGICRNTLDDDFCDTGLFCNAMFCHPQLDCIFDGYVPPNDLDCLAGDGNPCPNPAACDEATDTCGGCKAPTVVAGGSRYLLVTPADQGSDAVALKVIGECGDMQSACVDRYVLSKCNGGPNHGVNCVTDDNCPKTCVGGTTPGASCTVPADCFLGICNGFCDEGTLGSIPFYKLPSQWGTAKVRGAQIRPAANYLVETVCRFPTADVRSNAVRATTWKWGDIDGNGIVSALDVASVVNLFRNLLGAVPFEQGNVWPCVPDANIDALDIVSVVDAFRGFSITCAIVCP